MIAGVVQAHEARIRLRVRGPRGRVKDIEAIIDTGYTGWLTLPPALVRALKLPWKSFVWGELADGSKSVFDVYEATVVWDRRARRIPVNEADTEPLVGMALLEGSEVTLQVRHRGKVTIKPLP
jgi:clan AA aspartic protease